MVRYRDIKNILSEYLTDDHRHLFKFSGINIEFWAKPRANEWRIVTDLPIEELRQVARTLQEHGENFSVQEAWGDISRPVFATPPMNSQLVGQIESLDTINRIWIAILSTHENNPSPPQIRLNEPIKLPQTPRGRDIDSIAVRLMDKNSKKEEWEEQKETEEKVEKKRVIKRKEKKEKIDSTEFYNEHKEEVDEFIKQMRRNGHTYREISEMATEQFDCYISRYRVGKVVRNQM